MSESGSTQQRHANEANQPLDENCHQVQPASDSSLSPPLTSLFGPYDLWFAQVLVLVLTAGIAGYFIFRLSFPNAEQIVLREPGKPYAYVIDINEADWIHWMLLPGIGEKLAKKIIIYREQHGRFNSIDDLLKVNGIGNITLETLKPHLECHPESEINSPDREQKNDNQP